MLFGHGTPRSSQIQNYAMLAMAIEAQPSTTFRRKRENAGNVRPGRPASQYAP